MLTRAQLAAAQHLRAVRPDVVPGTDAIIGDRARSDWYRRVTNTMRDVGVSDKETIQEFCNAAGVAQ